MYMNKEQLQGRIDELHSIEKSLYSRAGIMFSAGAAGIGFSVAEIMTNSPKAGAAIALGSITLELLGINLQQSSEGAGQQAATLEAALYVGQDDRLHG